MFPRLLSSFLALAALASAATNVFNDTTGNGLWGTAANWSLGTVPAGTDSAVVNVGRVATLASAAPTVDTIVIGNTAHPQTKLVIFGDLSATNFRVASAGAGTWGSVEQFAGAVSASTTFLIASNAAGVDTGSYTIAGGSLTTGPMTVGTLGNGILAITDTGATNVSATSLTLGSAATLKFTLGTLGVTRLTVTGTWTVDVASKLVVDGTNYESLDGFFPLIDGGAVSGSFVATNVTFTGFGARNPALVYQNGDLWLRVLPPAAASSQLLTLVPASTVATDFTGTTFTSSRALEASGSAWSLTWNEAHVMDTRLTQDVSGATNRSWDLRLGRGGQIYSFRTPALGELVPPQYRANDVTYGSQYAPWNDEVWQGVAVDIVQNNLPDGDYFIHQAGVYLKDPALTEPFYSPQVAAAVDAGTHSFTTINWGQHAHLGNYTDATTVDDFQSHLLYFTRYRDLGQGVIEVSLGLYNYGPDNLNFFNMPWGGVRRTSTGYAFLSQPGGAAWFQVSDLFGAGSGQGTGVIPKFNDAGGWMAFCNSSDGSTPALALVCGFDSTPLLTNQTSASLWHTGYAGGASNPDPVAWRNYFVVEAVRRYNLTRGRGIWGRYYFVLGDSVGDVASRIAARNLTANATLSAFDYPTTTTPLIGYRTTGSGASFRVVEDNVAPQFQLYAHPVAGSFPLYEIIQGDGTRYLTWNPYEAAPIKTYTGQIAGIRLLGFILRSTDATNTAPTAPLSACLAVAPSNYRASGEIFTAGVATNIESWRATHLGTTANAGTATDSADADGDGFTNFAEHVLGLVPTTATAPLLTTSVSGGNVTLTFTARQASGSGYLGLTRTYDVESTTNLADAFSWQPLAGYTGIVGAGQTVNVVQPIGASPRFYRLKATLSP